MHRHLRHVQSPDSIDSMANESKRKQAPQASSGRAWQAEEAAESLSLTKPSQTAILRETQRDRGGSKQWRREPGAGSRCKKKMPGEADLQDNMRLVARLVVKMKMGSCG